LNRKSILILFAAALIAAACAPAKVMPPSVTPSGEDRYLVDPRLGWRGAPADDRFEAAWRYFLAGNDAEASRLLAGLPDYAPAMLAQAAIDMRSGRFDEAQRTIEALRVREPDYTAARVYEAELAYRRRETRRAHFRTKRE
jgi:predicted Zn-dependent protease